MARSNKIIRVYVAGPISKGNKFLNCVKGVQVADQLRQLGYYPFCPHLSYWWEQISGRPPTYGEWLTYDFEWILCCDAVYRIPGDSIGADQEEDFAKQHGIPVYYSIKELQKKFPIKKSKKKEM